MEIKELGENGLDEKIKQAFNETSIISLIRF